MDTSYLGYRVLALVLLTALNAFFSAAEVALLSVRPSRMQALAAQGNLGAQAALTLMANMERMLSLCQAGITLASLGMGWAGEEAIYDALIGFLRPYLTPQTEILFRGVSFAAAFLFLTFVIVVIGEVVPKNLAVEKSERMAVLTSPPLLVCYRLLEPFVYIIEKSSAAVSRLLGLKTTQHGGGHSAEEIKHIVSASGELGQLRPFEHETITRVLDLAGLVAREVMVPRSMIVSLPVDAGLDDVLRTMSEQNYSRVPIFKDRPDNIVGVVHYRDLLRVWRERRFANERRRTARPFHLADWMRKPLVVPETKPLDELIANFRQSHSHLALVVDEFGSVSGIVTMEDVFEQVFGEIEDEHDARRQPHRREAESIEIEGTVPIRDLETQYGIVLPFDAGFETLAGFMLSRLGFIPKGGETVVECGRRFIVLAMDRNRIATVRIERVPETAASAEPRPVPA
jgi:putative hemolysin